MLAGERAPIDGVSRLFQQGRNGVFHFADAFADGNHRGVECRTAGTCLMYSHIVGLSCLCKCLQCGYGLIPVSQCFAGNGKLLVQHQQCVVTFGYGCRDLCLYRLFISTAFFERGSGFSFGVGHASKYVRFPSGTHANVVGLLRLTVVVTGTCLWCQSGGWQV